MSDHLIGYGSATKLGMLNRCGRQFAYRYLDGIKSPPVGKMLVGTANHQAQEENLLSKRDKGIGITKEGFLAVAEDTFLAEVDEVANEHPEAWEKDALGRDKGLDHTIQTAGVNFDVIQPTFDGDVIAQVEQNFTIELAEFDLPPFVGVIDVIEMKNGHARVRDLKVSAVTGHSPYDTQGLWYAYALYAISGGQDMPHVRKDVLYTKPKTPYYLNHHEKKDGTKWAGLLEGVPTNHDMQRIVGEYKVAVDLIDNKTFLPAKHGEWPCTPKACGYWGICPYGGASFDKSLYLGQIELEED